ncbi:MAG: DUF1343 domain-containing protein [Bacteroidetes bacterium]|nr:MAG: DUF1343 domain-containing protein [Bacteroidota bacterium]
MRLFKLTVILVFLQLSLSSCNQQNDLQLIHSDNIITGVQNTQIYLPLLLGKKIAVVTNHASRIGKTHIVDSLKSLKVNVVKIFSPEHGFRGKADAGEKIKNNVDSKTQLPVISLYGNHKKPTTEDFSGIDIVVFDLQDVGVRFYTYISTLTYVMEACAENNIPLIVLDRPNPNGFYIDGPILEPAFKSFVGLHPVPVVYGMTIGEYAKMVNGEGWLENNQVCDLTVVPLKDYSHNMIIELPVKPSPNLPNWESVYLYPSLCFLEGTIMSVGRGTDFPFQVFGHPDFILGSFLFTPQPNEGSKHPKYEGKQCNGSNVIGYANNYKNNPQQINLSYLINTYNMMKLRSDDYFNDYFNTLAGNDKLQKQIKAGMTEKDIRETWRESLEAFKKIRARYLMYD